MKLETYKEAKYLRSLIDQLNVRLAKVSKFRAREKDEEFNNCREIAREALTNAIAGCELEFKNLK